MWRRDTMPPSRVSADLAHIAAMSNLKAGLRWVVEADLKDFFDTLDWTVLRQALATQIADPHVIELIQRFLQAGARCGPHAYSLTRGTPQGAVFSPLAANVYLTSFD